MDLYMTMNVLASCANIHIGFSFCSVFVIVKVFSSGSPPHPVSCFCFCFTNCKLYAYIIPIVKLEHKCSEHYKNLLHRTELLLLFFLSHCFAPKSFPKPFSKAIKCLLPFQREAQFLLKYGSA